MSIFSIILIVLLVLLIAGAIPQTGLGWPNYLGGPYPYGGLGVILIILLIIVLIYRI